MRLNILDEEFTQLGIGSGRTRPVWCVTWDAVGIVVVKKGERVGALGKG